MKLGRKINPLSKIKEALGTNGIVLIVTAAVLLEVITAIQYRYARQEIAEDLAVRAQSELSAKSLAIGNVMTEVETAVRNHTEDVSRQLAHPDSMYGVAKSLIVQNDIISGSSVSFLPNYYPGKGYWFEAFAGKREGGEVEIMQLGSENHDYFKREFFENVMKTGKGGWTNPYLDNEGAKMMLTTYSEPVYDKHGKIVGVLAADISLDWLDEVLAVEYVYPSSYHILLSKTGQLMSVPDKSFVMKTVREMASQRNDTSFNHISDEMLAGKTGEALIKEKGGDSYQVFYAPMEGDTGWSLAIVNSEREVYGEFQEMKKNLLKLRLVGLAILIFIIARAVRNVKRLQKVTSEKEKIRSELNVARNIQMGMLPKKNLSEEKGELKGQNISVEGILIPAKEVGGDLYDYYMRDRKLFFCIGDVSGKGVPASLFMTVTRSLFRNISGRINIPSEILSQMNDTMVEMNDSNMFVTIFVGVLDLNTGMLEYCNAGHDSPVLIDSKVSSIPVISNIPVGILKDYVYVGQRITLPSDCILFLYTDGLTEAKNKDHEEFNEDRMTDCLKKFATHIEESTPAAIIDSMKEDIERFVGNADQSDDLTMLAIKYMGKEENNGVKELTLTNKINEISVLNSFIEEWGKELMVSPQTLLEIRLALEEVVVNIINYAYPENTAGYINITACEKGDVVEFTVRDKGIPFNPLDVAEADIISGAEERKIGGLGIFLVRQMMDGLRYECKDGENILTLIKVRK